MGRITDRLLDELGVAQPGDDQRGGPLRMIAGGVEAIFGRLGQVVFDTADGPGWTMLLDPDRCPSWALGWAAQFYGVQKRVRDAPDEATARALMTAPPALRRGGADAIRAAVAATLTSKDPAMVQVIPRAGGPNLITVRVRAADCPDPSASAAVAERDTPWWLKLTFVVSNSPLIDEATRLGNNVTVTGDAAVLADVT